MQLNIKTNKPKQKSRKLIPHYLDELLCVKKDFILVRSVYDDTKITYDEFCSQLSPAFFNKLLETNTDLKYFPLCEYICQTLVYGLNNLPYLSQALKTYFTETVNCYIEYLKIVLNYPEVQLDEVTIKFTPLLVDTVAALNTFINKK